MTAVFSDVDATCHVAVVLLDDPAPTCTRGIRAAISTFAPTSWRPLTAPRALTPKGGRPEGLGKVTHRSRHAAVFVLSSSASVRSPTFASTPRSRRCEIPQHRGVVMG